MERCSEALNLWVKPTDNELHWSVITWALYWGISDVSVSFFLGWSDSPEKTFLISYLRDKGLVANTLWAKQKYINIYLLSCFQYEMPILNYA